MSKYQITLSPVDKFFFGGDMTFEIKDSEKGFNEQFSSYIIKSSMYPQQTSLLGMLRFLILRNAGDEIFSEGKIVNKDRAKKLIGSRSFTVNSGHTENDFGYIKSLSHVRIRKKTKDKVYDFEFNPLFGYINFEKSSEGTYNLRKICIPCLSKDEFNAKKGLDEILTNGCHLDDIFVEDRRMGIDRDITTGKTEDDALYKQISYRFKNDAQYCFVFDAEVDNNLKLEAYSGQMVSIGGDNSQFVVDISNKVINECDVKAIDNAIYTLSPTYLTLEEVRKARFAITKLMPFRFLESEMDKVDSYHILSKQLKRSSKYELYAPGSVFYFENEQNKREFIKLIESKKEFRQIGYNEYK